MDYQTLEGFHPQTVEKVERLFNLLNEISSHPDLKGKLALYGGTAINLFMLDVPRLSVDIDLSYIGTVDRDGMLADRAIVEQGLIEVARAQGYSVSGKEGGHAGRTFILRYRSAYGPDQVKVDCIYMNRLPLLSVESRTPKLEADISFPTFADAELIGGKTKAFFDRVTVRDLYDVANLAKCLQLSNDEDRELAHKVILFYASLSASFPFGFEERTNRFSGKQAELEEQLYPMLRESDLEPTIGELCVAAGSFITEYVLPRGESEEEYLNFLRQGEYAPELLFEEGEIAAKARVNPEALWKVQNIKQMF